MRSLVQALQDHDLVILRVIGEWWELDLTGLDKEGAVTTLAANLSRIDMQQELLFLPEEEAAALQDLIAQGGRAPVAIFGRHHGELRLMGPGRMEREEPWLEPASPVEALWFRGLLYRGFDETAEGLIEFYYLPNELMANFPQQEIIKPSVAISLLAPVADEPQNPQPATTTAVDDLTALLAVALQLTVQKGERPDLDRLLIDPDPERRSMLLTLAHELGLIRQNNGQIRPTRTAVSWLKDNREAQLFALADAWSHSDWNDLCHTPGLVCEGENWHNDPILARTTLIDVLPRENQWYALSDLVNLVKENHPDFQRPDGNYNTWYIRRTGEKAYLSGFESWDEVEGHLLRFLIQGPLYWLGMVQLAGGDSGEPALFSLTDRAIKWLAGDIKGREENYERITIEPDGTIVVPRSADRYIRFQVARISESLALKENQPYHYQLTANSLAKAAEQGIKTDRLLQFLNQASADSLPKSVERAISRWAENGIEGRLETAVVLRVMDERILETLRSNPRTRDYLGESLGDLAVVVKPGKAEQLRAATAQLGLLLEIDV